MQHDVKYMPKFRFDEITIKQLSFKYNLFHLIHV